MWTQSPSLEPHTSPCFLTPLTCSLTTTFPRKSSWPLSFRASLKILFQAGAMRGVGQGTGGVRLGSVPLLWPPGLDRACGPATDSHAWGGQPTLLPPGTRSRGLHLRSPCRSVSSPSFCLTDSTVSISLRRRGAKV